jgi:hypothetical protein
LLACRVKGKIENKVQKAFFNLCQAIKGEISMTVGVKVKAHGRRAEKSASRALVIRSMLLSSFSGPRPLPR